MQMNQKSKFFSYLRDQFSPFRDFFGFIAEISKIILISLAIILPIRYFLVQPFYVKGESMEPSFYNNDYLIINEIGYRFNDPLRGDVVIFKYPKDPKEYFIKRVIGIPGDRVVIKDNKVIIYPQNSEEAIQLKEDYLDPNEVTTKNIDVRLKAEEYFVMGDNRSHSLDSRVFGTVSDDLIIGKVWFRGWPFSRWGVIEGPEYNIN